MTRVIAGTLLAQLLPVAAQAQGLERQVYARQDATVRLSYASRPGVCGGSNGNISMSDGDDERDGWTSDCEKGPVRVAITLKQGAVTQLTTRVGGRCQVRVKPSAIAATCPAEMTMFPGSPLLRLDTKL